MSAELVCPDTDRDRWLEERRKGVTATDIVTVLGLNPQGSAFALFHEKRGNIAPWEGNARTRLGQRLEPYVASLWAEETGRSLGVFTGLFRHSERAWQMATPDRLIASGGEGVLECKTWADADRRSWEAGGMPARVRAQVLWQMDVLGVPTGHVGVLFLPSGEFESRVIQHIDAEIDMLAPLGGRPFNGEVADCEVCTDQGFMREAGLEFWGRVLSGMPPALDGSPAALAAVKRLHADVCAGTREISPDVWEEYFGARETMKYWREQASQYEAMLREEIGDAEYGTVGGVRVVRRQAVAVKEHVRKASVSHRLVRVKGDSGE